MKNVMSVIDIFVMETPGGKSPWTKQSVFYIVRFFALEQIPKIKRCHMVVSEHPKVIEGERWLINMDVINTEEASEGGMVDADGAA